MDTDIPLGGWIFRASSQAGIVLDWLTSWLLAELLRLVQPGPELCRLSLMSALLAECIGEACRRESLGESPMLTTRTYRLLGVTPQPHRPHASSGEAQNFLVSGVSLRVLRTECA